MTRRQDVVFLLDADNTLLDNDRIIEGLRAHLEHEFGIASAARYWAIFEGLRSDLGYADYLGALQRYRLNAELDAGTGPRLLQVSAFLIDYPFADRPYPHGLEVIERLSSFGPTVVLTDGDVVFQPCKVRRSGLWNAVYGRVLIYIHKEQMLDAMQRLCPARHHVMVDDKLRIPAAMKQAMPDRLTTIFPRQGHYALGLAAAAACPPADLSIERIGQLLHADTRSLATPQEQR